MYWPLQFVHFPCVSNCDFCDFACSMNFALSGWRRRSVNYWFTAAAGLMYILHDLRTLHFPDFNSSCDAISNTLQFWLLCILRCKLYFWCSERARNLHSCAAQVFMHLPFGIKRSLTNSWFYIVCWLVHLLCIFIWYNDGVPIHWTICWCNACCRRPLDG